MASARATTVFSAARRAASANDYSCAHGRRMSSSISENVTGWRPHEGNRRGVRSAQREHASWFHSGDERAHAHIYFTIAFGLSGPFQCVDLDKAGDVRTAPLPVYPEVRIPKALALRWGFSFEGARGFLVVGKRLLAVPRRRPPLRECGREGMSPGEEVARFLACPHELEERRHGN